MRTKSSKLKTTFSKGYEIGHDYSGLLRALEESFERQGRHRVKLADVKDLTQDGSTFRLYCAPGSLEKLSPPVQEGWTIEASPNSPRAVVTQVDLDDDLLTVRCSAAHPGQRFAQTISLSAPDFLLRLRNWIAEKQGRPFPKLLTTLNQTSLSSLSETSLLLEEKVIEALRPAQLKALSSVGSGILQLWGPPGTGKTYTVARAVRSLVALGYRVALLAPTNVAVDTAVLAIRQAYLEGKEPLVGGNLIRAGDPQLEELEDYPELLAWQQSLRSQQLEIQTLRMMLRDLERSLASSKGQEKLSLLRDKEELKQDLALAREDRREELWDLARNAQILATTVYSGLHRDEMTAFFSCEKVAVVIDEAGMVPRYATLPILELLGGGEAPQGTLTQPPSEVTLLFAGDPRQLAPIHSQRNERDVNMRYWLGESLMEELLDDRSAPNIRQLDEQSRMDPTICRRISKTYYDGSLKTLADPQRPKPPLTKGWPTDGVVLVDARKAALPEDAPPESKLGFSKKMNQRTLQVGLRLIREALQGKARSVLWLTPFRDQARLARKLADTNFSDFQDFKVRVGTVHTSQGGEADLVIFDPVLIRHRWLRGAIGGDLDIERLINVAVSRGRGQVIVFGTRQDLAKNDLFRRLLNDAADWDGGGG